MIFILLFDILEKAFVIAAVIPFPALLLGWCAG